MQKFENVDILACLDAVMKQNTGFYQSDFEIDKEIIHKAAASPDREDGTLLWLSRPSGTHCFRERDVFLKDTRPYNTWKFHGQQTRDRILAYAVELTGRERGKIRGNLYELDYAAHFRHVREQALPADTVTLFYERGERSQPIRSMARFSALRCSQTTPKPCAIFCKRNGAAVSSFRRGTSRRISPPCATG